MEEGKGKGRETGNHGEGIGGTKGVSNGVRPTGCEHLARARTHTHTPHTARAHTYSSHIHIARTHTHNTLSKRERWDTQTRANPPNPSTPTPPIAHPSPHLLPPTRPLSPAVHPSAPPAHVRDAGDPRRVVEGRLEEVEHANDEPSLEKMAYGRTAQEPEPARDTHGQGRVVAPGSPG